MSGTINIPAPESTGADYFDLGAALEALDSGAPLVFPPFHITRLRIGGHDLTFCSNFDRDPVQKAQRKGAFFEAEDLAKVAEHLPKAPRVLDVGANVGNHAIYFATQCDAASVIVVEPNPLALAPLVANIVLNNLTDVIRMDALGVGLGAESEAGLFMKRHDRNLGGTKMLRGRDGDLEVHAGDMLFEEEQFDLIKIDVEGMEMEVLTGLEATVERCKPLLFIEVDDANAEAFQSWCSKRGYQSVFEVRHYGANMNFFMKYVGENA
ncbi:FkbM family methyltransferase [uncultured Pelagimonas sp.]|uniref:FkbM family methyltransferase n=1 Tax=uncultured Pelagimonas sp. TaxID=1618102 RepID=UPI00261BE8A9|nr:FkbM family methyltransferase [uncultured Pelagimonas sp.]